jgi:hypothetical protein
MVCLPVVSRYVLWIEWVVESTGKGVWTSISLIISHSHRNELLPQLWSGYVEEGKKRKDVAGKEGHT